MQWFSKLPTWLFVCCIAVGSVALHALAIDRLPVFADEAIYIRWAQLIIDDPQQYLFFPLNDGKTPLFIWMLVPFLKWGLDPLVAARWLAVAGGFFQIVLMASLVKQLKGGRVAQIAAALLTALMPFWFFHHHMSLMDGWLSVWLTLALVAALTAQGNWKWIIVAGGALGAAFLTKLPAVLFLPSLVIIPFALKDSVDVSKKLLVSASVLAVGLLIFATLKISPAFPQLFFRGSDFLYPVSEVLEGRWMQTIRNIPSYLNYFWQYATPGVIALFLVSFAFIKIRRTQLLLLLGFLCFVVPISIMGKVVYPRYFLPAAIFLTVGAALAVEQFVAYVQASKNKALLSFLVLGILSVAYTSGGFIYSSITNSDAIPFVSADRTQYLTEWSSGHGIKEVYLKLTDEAKTKKVAVATEGFFGTLPDGLLLYLHNADVTNIVVEGVGQPIESLPPKLIEKKDTYDRLWILVNSHRMKFELDERYLLEEYCRPYDGPCLQLWDVTDVIKATQS